MSVYSATSRRSHPISEVPSVASYLEREDERRRSGLVTVPKPHLAHQSSRPPSMEADLTDGRRGRRRTGQHRRPSSSTDHDDDDDASSMLLFGAAPPEDDRESQQSLRGTEDTTSLLPGRRRGSAVGGDNAARQTLHIDDDVLVELAGYREVWWQLVAYRILCVVTGGLWYLLCRWLPRWYLWCTSRVVPFPQATMILCVNSWAQVEILPVRRQRWGNSSVSSDLSSIFAAFTKYSQEVEQEEEQQQQHRSPTVNAVASPPVANLQTQQHLLVFDYHCMVFIFNPITGLFVENTAWKPTHNYHHGLTRREYDERREFFGTNSIEIPRRSTFRLLVDEVLHPFFVFQVFSIIVWVLDNYIYYAMCILVISVGSIWFSLRETHENYERLRRMSEFHCEVRVLRDGQWVAVNADDLVPGDIYEIGEELEVVPADSVLLAGDCIINESMLTGESVPVIKTPADDEVKRLLKDSVQCDPKHYLFRGTHVIRARPEVTMTNGESVTKPAQAVVVRTGFNSAKGNLIRSIMFPKPSSFQLYEDSFRFLQVLAFIAMIGFSWTVVHYVQKGLDARYIILRSLDLILIVVPPALPAAMSIGTSFAIHRLKLGGIFCVSPPRVNVCGTLNLVVFDKTGTLTEDGLDVYGVRPSGADLVESVEQVHRLSPRSPSDKPIVTMTEAMATCHSLKLVRDELIGDPLDLKMFEFTKWVLEEPMSGANAFPAVVRPPGTNALELTQLMSAHDKIVAGGHDGGSGVGKSKPLKTEEVAVVKIHEFASALKRMSVVVHRLKNRLMKVYCKGAPEVIREICEVSSLPPDFDETLAQYSSLGLRVIALAGRVMPSGTTWYQVTKMAREQVESSLHFLGFLVFENRLKPQTVGVLDKLAGACIRDVMCTGDNLLTAVSVARECGLISADSLVYTPILKLVETEPGLDDIVEEEVNELVDGEVDLGDEEYAGKKRFKECLVWQCINDDRLFLNPKTLVPMATYTILDQSMLGSPSSMSEMRSPPEDTAGRNHYDTLSMSNRNRRPKWRKWLNNLKQNTNFDVLPAMESAADGSPRLAYDLAITGDMFSYLLTHLPRDTLNRMLVKTDVYARMSPENKHELVENLRELGYCVGMVGDGANDCSALKSADVGISLSEAEASVAAPFTSAENNISCVLRAIREGRAALVTSFNCFKYIALYSMIQFISVTLLYSMEVTLADFQFLYIDLFIILPIAVLMGRTGPAKKIHRKPPTGRLMSKKVLTSLIGHIVISALFQAIIFFNVRQQPFYSPRDDDASDHHNKCYENTAVFLLSAYQYLGTAWVFSAGGPYRQSIWKNWSYMLTMVVLAILCTYMTLVPDQWTRTVLELMELPFEYRAVIVGLAGVNFVVSLMGERYFLPALASLLRHVFFLDVNVILSEEAEQELLQLTDMSAKTSAATLSSSSSSFKHTFLSDLRAGQWPRVRRWRKPYKIIAERLRHEQ